MSLLHKTSKTEDEWPISLLLSYLSKLYTLLAFLAACGLLPWLLLLYLGEQVWVGSWRRWLERKYPGLEFIRRTTTRTVVDTPRNQCILSLLLTVQGPPQLHLIRNRVKEEIVERRREGGRLVFPHLKCRLTWRWGCYAWIRGSEREFRLESHVLLAPGLFKGRPISASNIQEVASDLTAKLLPTESPPWQILAIPGSGECSYLLLRLHHLYLSEEGLSLSDILHHTPPTWQPLLDHSVFRAPTVIPRVCSAILESASNMWNEIISNYDPIEKPEVIKHPSLKSCFFLACIVIFASFKTYFSSEEPSPTTTSSSSLHSIFENEMQRRCLSFALLTEGFHNTFSVRLLLNGFLRSLRIPIQTIKLPFRLFKLVLNTPVYLYWLYLGHYALQELAYLFGIIYKAPRVLFEELFLPERPSNVHQLQTISFCGRKVVRWSEPVPKEIIQQISSASGGTESEVLLAGVASALREYFLRAGFSLPEYIMTTCQFSRRLQLPGAGKAGFLCLPLPMQAEPFHSCLERTRQSLFKAKESQTALYLAGELGLGEGLLVNSVPPLLAKAAFYLLSRRYTVALSLVEGAKESSLLWGQSVQRLMYWSPPQGNVCMSITVMCYGDRVEMGVMADSQLAPHHSVITSHFAQRLTSLAATQCSGLPRQHGAASVSPLTDSSFCTKN